MRARQAPDAEVRQELPIRPTFAAAAFSSGDRAIATTAALTASGDSHATQLREIGRFQRNHPDVLKPEIGEPSRVQVSTATANPIHMERYAQAHKHIVGEV